jgi:hypothetical protein
MTVIVIGTIRMIRVIKGTSSIDRIHVPDIVMIDIIAIETGMREDVQRIATEIETIATAMIDLTDAGPATATIMTMREAVNDEGSMMVENHLDLLTIGMERSHIVMSQYNLQGISIREV